mgnify:FL=1
MAALHRPILGRARRGGARPRTIRDEPAMLLCSTCGATTAEELDRCRRDARSDCPFERLPGRARSSVLFGTAVTLVGVAVASAISAVLFVNPPVGTGVAAVVQALLLIGVYTFVYTIAGVFVGIGMLAALSRRVGLADRAGGRFVEAWTLLGRTLSLQVTELDETVTVPQVETGRLPSASVAALRRVAAESGSTGARASMVERVRHGGETSRRMVRACLGDALTSLVAGDAVRLRPARVRVVWPFLTRQPTLESDVVLLETRSGSGVRGALEATLLERIREWPEKSSADYPLATVRELVRTFGDGDGDFSAQRVLRLVEEEGVSEGWLERRPRLTTTRLLPEPGRALDASASEALTVWSDALDTVRDAEPRLFDRLGDEIDAVLDPSRARVGELQRRQGRLRAALAKRLVAGSALLATLVYLTSVLL